MKKTFLILSVMIMSATAFAGGIKFQKTMGKTLAGFGEAQTVEDYRELGNKFLRIAEAEKNEWLPYYYHAQCYILMSFEEKENPENKDEYLDEAQKSVDRLKELAPGESETYVMQGLLYTARLMVDPMTRGQKYGAMSAQAIGQALGMEPDNPRARYMQLANSMGTAQFFGEDVSKYCGQAQQLYDDWDNYKPKSRIHPNWGKSQVAGLLQQCGSSE